MALSLGIGLNVAVFSIIDAIFLRPLGVSAPTRLLYIQPASEALVEIREFRERTASLFDAVTAHTPLRAVLSHGGDTRFVTGEIVEPDYFDVLGVKAAVGRTFSRAEEGRHSTEASVVISYGLWAERFNREMSAIGQAVRIDDSFYTVIGVAPPGFLGLQDRWISSQLWVTGAQFYGPIYRPYSRHLIGRLHDGVSAGQARATLGSLEKLDRSRTGFIARPASQVLMPFQLAGGASELRSLGSAATVLALVVLVVAAINIGGLQAAHWVLRGNDVAIRYALGATSGRVIRQVLTENLALGGVGFAGGLLTASLLLEVYRFASPDRVMVDAVWNAGVVAFALTVCIGASLISALFPAVRVRSRRLTVSVTAAEPAGRISRMFRYCVVVPQLTISVAFLLVALFYTSTLAKLTVSHLGYETERSVAVVAGYWVTPGFWDDRLTSPAVRSQRTHMFWRLVLERVRESPGVDRAALSTRSPVSAIALSSHKFVSREAFGAGGSGVYGEFRGGVTPQYFGTIQTPLLSGRDFDGADTSASLPVAIVSHSLAALLWPGGSAIGRSLGVLGPSSSGKIEWLDVIGTVGDVNPVMDERRPRPALYRPLAQIEVPAAIPLTVLASSEHARSDLGRIVQEAVLAADPSAQVTRKRTIRQEVSEILYARRSAAWVFGLSSAIGLLLAAVALYGMYSYSLARQSREFAVRRALGASAGHILRLVIQEAITVSVVGTAAGLIVGIAAVRLASRLFGGTAAIDLPVLLAAPLVVALIAVLACYFPARRAIGDLSMSVLRDI